MPNSDGMYLSDTPLTDMEIFIGLTSWRSSTGAVLGSESGNLFISWNNAALDCYASCGAVLKRTGIYSNPDLMQEAFGTLGVVAAASAPPGSPYIVRPQPGPSSISGTSDPLGIQNIPPMPSSRMPTRVGAQSGPIAKGIKINSVDVLHTNFAAQTNVQFGLKSIQFLGDNAAGNQQAPVVTDLIAYGNNGLSLIATPPGDGSKWNKKNIVVATPSFIILPDTEVVARFTSTPTGSNAFQFQGIVLH